MADEKKISGLTEATDVSASDEFVVVNKDVVEGQDASASGQTSKITLGNLRKSIFGGDGGGSEISVSPPLQDGNIHGYRYLTSLNEDFSDKYTTGTWFGTEVNLQVGSTDGVRYSKGIHAQQTVSSGANLYGPSYGVFGLSYARAGGTIHGHSISIYGQGAIADDGDKGHVTGDLIGVYGSVYPTQGIVDGNRWAGYFNGNTCIDGNLTIGTDSPSDQLPKLHVSDDDGGLEVLFESTGDFDMDLKLKAGASTPHSYFMSVLDDMDLMRIWPETAGSLSGIRMNGAGNVGIGIGDREPHALLDLGITGRSNEHGEHSLRVDNVWGFRVSKTKDDAGNPYTFAHSSALYLEHNNGGVWQPALMSFTRERHVGIGDVTFQEPQHPLHIIDEDGVQLGLTRKIDIKNSTNGAATKIVGGAMVSNNGDDEMNPTHGAGIGFSVADSSSTGNAAATQGYMYFETKDRGGSLTEKVRITHEGVLQVMRRVGGEAESINSHIRVGDKPYTQYSPTGHFYLGNNPWADMTNHSREWSDFYYSNEHGGMVMKKGNTQIHVRCRMPVDKFAKYEIKVRAQRLVDSTIPGHHSDSANFDLFYVGMASRDENHETLQTDKATTWNYGVVGAYGQHQLKVSDGSTVFTSIVGDYDGGGAYNDPNKPHNEDTRENIHRKFDPDASFFDLVIIANYFNGPIYDDNDASQHDVDGETVIQSIEIKKID